jgi:hypothetical protein
MTDAEILASVGIFYFTEVRPPASGAAPQPIGALPPAPVLPTWSPHAAGTERKRWSLDTWSLLRPGPGTGTFGPQLGGSQAGARLAYFFDAQRRTAAYARMTTALDDGDVELGAGVQWQPTKLPVAGFAEARTRQSGAVVPVFGLVGGVYRTPIAGAWRLDGYGQAGVVGGKRREGFADGQLRATRPLGVVGPTAFEAGLGTWGGIQRDAGRFDLGPTLGIELPVHGGNLRLTLDWRQRVAGHAAPASGPALTLSAGF